VKARTSCTYYIPAQLRYKQHNPSFQNPRAKTMQTPVHYFAQARKRQQTPSFSLFFVFLLGISGLLYAEPIQQGQKYAMATHSFNVFIGPRTEGVTRKVSPGPLAALAAEAGPTPQVLLLARKDFSSFPPFLKSFLAQPGTMPMETELFCSLGDKGNATAVP
jgi:hypothetical protein